MRALSNALDGADGAVKSIGADTDGDDDNNVDDADDDDGTNGCTAGLSMPRNVA
jgi:hypothetical protein